MFMEFSSPINVEHYESILYAERKHAIFQVRATKTQHNYNQFYIVVEFRPRQIQQNNDSIHVHRNDFNLLEVKRMEMHFH